MENILQSHGEVPLELRPANRDAAFGESSPSFRECKQRTPKGPSCPLTPPRELQAVTLCKSSWRSP